MGHKTKMASGRRQKSEINSLANKYTNKDRELFIKELHQIHQH